MIQRSPTGSVRQSSRTTANHSAGAGVLAAMRWSYVRAAKQRYCSCSVPGQDVPVGSRPLPPDDWPSPAVTAKPQMESLQGRPLTT